VDGAIFGVFRRQLLRIGDSRGDMAHELRVPAPELLLPKQTLFFKKDV
jgi:hypothetical protein